jgi:tripartite-type tricarboxylate transporter receptor subunit TctC
VAPAATPTAVVQRLNGELVKILEMADVRVRLIDQRADVGGGTRADFAAFMNEERNRWGVVVREAGIKPE